MLAGTDVTEILNLRGLKCPLPALKTRKTLRTLPPGAEILVECTDPMAVIDIPHMVRETGDVLLDTRRTEDAVIFRIRRA
jgi:tRNA 2-thiouridine synthesizing protein A